jgi:hypothetical protein
MRYILIDPYTKTVTEASNPALAYEKARTGNTTLRHRETLYQIIGCHRIEWHDLRIIPQHDILIDENASFMKPQPPSFLLGGVHVIGRAVILGRRGRNSVMCSLPLDRVTPHVRFDAGPKTVHPPEIITFETYEELQAFRATRTSASGSGSQTVLARLPRGIWSTT